MAELWQQLQVGDHVRLTEIPSEFLEEGYYIHPDTLRVYEKLLARRRTLRICKIDEYGFPWAYFRLMGADGYYEFHWLALNHDGLVRVQPRPK